ncbi:MAG: hypothetical protein ACM30H_02530 [Clostridia bacterium]
MSPNGDSCRLTAALFSLLRRVRRGVPGRDAVRDAVLLAERGHDTLIDARRGGGFRAVIVDRREDRTGLRVLARVGRRAVLGRW